MKSKLKQLAGIIPLIIVTVISIPVIYSCSGKREAEPERPNILFIPVDDLRTELGCYGNTSIRTPNIDRLASSGVTFMRTYCQQAVCNPSRASLLTGLRPDSIQVWDLQTGFRNNVPDVITLPQFFKQNGYTVLGLGKTFHNNIPDTVSWTEKLHIDGFPFDPDAVYANKENLKIQADKIEEMKLAGRSRIDQLGYWYVKANATECENVDDDFYYDGAQTTLAIELLKDLKSKGDPFFLSVGYYRPHLPFNAPKKYWDLYNRDSIPLAVNQYPPEGSPQFSVFGDAELRGYDDCHDLPFPHDDPWDEERQREMKHGYYASVSYTDAQIGRLIDALEELDLAENTIIVLWGDHGWKLGEHNGWGKMTNYESDTHVPMIIGGAGVSAKGKRCEVITEFLDIYPTLCDMAGLDIPDHLHGTSLTALLEDPTIEWNRAAFSQYLLGRFGPLELRGPERMGYTVRTDRYRYVEWCSWDKEANSPVDYLGNELYDHFSDPEENTNIAGETANKDICHELSEKLGTCFPLISTINIPE